MGKVSALMNPVTYVIINLATVVAHLGGGPAGGHGHPHPGRGGGPGQLHVPDSGGADQAGQPDHQHHQGPGLRRAGCRRCLRRRPASHGAPAGRAGRQRRRSGTAVEFRGVGLTYQGAADAVPLRHLALPSSRGRPWASSAAPAAARSSLVNLIPRFYDATQGAVLVDRPGRDATGPWSELRRQGRRGAPAGRAVSGNHPGEPAVGQRRDATDEEICGRPWTPPRQRNLWTRKPEGLDLPVAQGGKNLSGGQRQRLTIARALVRTAGDSDPGRQRLRPGLRHRRQAAQGHPEMEAQGLTVFIVSQRAASIRHADVIVVLDDGAGGGHRHPRASCWPVLPGLPGDLRSPSFTPRGGGVA